VASGKDNNKNLKTVIRIERTIMNKDRLEWVVSGLNQYNLTKAEDQFLKTALEDFDKNHALTERYEERLESLYKEKLQAIPNKKSDRFSVKKNNPQKAKPWRPRTRVF
jgi:DNA repair ATPase RecN